MIARFAWTRADVDRRRAWTESRVNNVDKEYLLNIVNVFTIQARDLFTNCSFQGPLLCSMSVLYHRPVVSSFSIQHYALKLLGV